MLFRTHKLGGVAIHRYHVIYIRNGALARAVFFMVLRHGTKVGLAMRPLSRTHETCASYASLRCGFVRCLA